MLSGPSRAWIIPGVRPLGRILLALVGLLLFAGGAGVAGYVGSDDTVFNAPTVLGADGRPVLTSPDLLALDGVTVTLRASAPEGVFIGTAHPVDVTDFMGAVPRVRLERVTRGGVEWSEVDGTAPRLRPEQAGFWTRSQSGTGVQELALDRDASAAQWVLAPVRGRGPTTVSFGITFDGLYRAALVTAGVGLLLLVVGVELLLRAGRRRRDGGAAPGAPTGPARDARASGGARRAQRPARGAGRGAGRGAALAAGLALSAVLATGCAQVLPVQRQPEELVTSKAALSPAELDAAYASYDARLRAALLAADAPRRDTSRFARADTGTALELDLADTRIRRASRLGGRPFVAHTPVAVYSRRFHSYPMWALATASTGRGADLEVDVLTRASVLAPWRLEARTTAPAADLPAPVAPGVLTSGGLVAEAESARQAWTDHLVSGDEGLAVDDATRAWRRDVARLAGQPIFSGFEVEATPPADADEVRVVPVEGGHLAVVEVRLTTRLTGRRGLNARWESPYDAYRGNHRGVLTFAHVAVGLVLLPDDGPARLLGSTFSEVPAPGPGSGRPGRGAGRGGR